MTARMALSLLRNDHHDPLPAKGVSPRTEYHRGLITDPNRPPVASDHPVFGPEGPARAVRDGAGPYHAVSVIREHQTNPQHRDCHPLNLGVALDGQIPLALRRRLTV